MVRYWIRFRFSKNYDFSANRRTGLASIDQPQARILNLINCFIIMENFKRRRIEKFEI